MCAGHSIRGKKHEFFIGLNVRIASDSSTCQSKLLVSAEGFKKKQRATGITGRTPEISYGENSL